MTMSSRRPKRTLAALLALSLIGAGARAAEIKTYLSLGDSLAFGYTDPAHLAPSTGDQGYVRPYADYLASRSNGVRPRVVNLGIAGETTDSYFAGGKPGTGLNLNYPSPTTSQHSQLLATLAAERAAGREISDVTVALGANDLFALTTNPGFLALPYDAQQAQLQQTLGTLQGRYSSLLTDLRFHLPRANLALVGLYNPFRALPGSPLAALAGQAIGAFNLGLAGQAAAFGGHYVDTFTPFVGHEAEYTFIRDLDLSGAPNVHPNAAGYTVIAQQIQAVPEPASVLILGAGVLGLIGLRRARRRGAAA
ncbi:MAG TPA: GDSL-type esterase/lipase family protein [Isosphaeraceae bacterium]